MKSCWGVGASDCRFHRCNSPDAGSFRHSVYEYFWPEVLSPQADLRLRPCMQSHSRLCITTQPWLNAIGQKKAYPRWFVGHHLRYT